MTELSPELQSELVEFVRDAADMHTGRSWLETKALHLLDKLPKPVDPDIEEARRVFASVPQNEGEPPDEEEQASNAEILAGKWDKKLAVRLAIAAIRRGRELERLSISVRHPSPVETAAALRELERSGK